MNFPCSRHPVAINASGLSQNRGTVNTIFLNRPYAENNLGGRLEPIEDMLHCRINVAAIAFDLGFERPADRIASLGVEVDAGLLKRDFDLCLGRQKLSDFLHWT